MNSETRRPGAWIFVAAALTTVSACGPADEGPGFGEAPAFTDDGKLVGLIKCVEVCLLIPGVPEIGTTLCVAAPLVDGLDDDAHLLCACNRATIWYEDADGDGFGDPATEFATCTPPAGAVEDSTDCDDADPENFPGNAEACDGQDNNCDGALSPNETDNDGDGVTECSNDCDDADAANFPGNAEICDGQDNNCDGALSPGETDDDGDGVTECDGDCDDAQSVNFPGNAEVCDGQDNNCDGAVSAEETDDDRDGFTECVGDCDDADPLNAAGNTEYCDGQDNNCNGLIDEGEPNAAGERYGLVGPITPLPEHGGPAGAPFTNDCPCGSVAVGIQGATLSWFGWSVISNFSLICEKLDASGARGARFPTNQAGIEGGDPFSVQCATGGVLIGQIIGENNYVATIGARCASLEAVLDGQTTTDAVLGPYQSQGGVPPFATYDDLCPPGQVIMGFEGHDGSVLDGLAMRCQALVLE